MWTQTVLRRWFVPAAVGLVVLSGFALTASHSEARSDATPRWVTTAKQRLAKLEVKQAGSMTGYSRAKFGPAWEDVDLNRCDTRNDILARDLRPHSFKGESECKVAEGKLD